MKLSTALSLLLTAAFASSTQADLLHRYDFFANARDSIGILDGTLFGNATISGGQLRLPGGAAGSGHYVGFSGSAMAINTYSTLTLELWATQPTNNQGFTWTVAFGDTWTNNGTGRNYLNLSLSRGDDRSLGAIANTPDSTNPWEDEKAGGGPELRDGLEHYYAFTVGPTNVALYIDGTLRGQQALGTTSLSQVATNFMFLGRSVYTGDALWEGSINELRIWNQALSSNQISANFQLGTAAFVPEPSTWALASLGLAALAWRRWRRA
jgi:hypothetical protein